MPRTHWVALKVESARQAARFYSKLFGLSPEKSDAEACRLLVRGEFRLVLFEEADEPAANGRLDHVCLQMSEEDRRSVQALALDLGCQILCESSHDLMFSDLYGIVWKVMAEPA